MVCQRFAMRKQMIGAIKAGATIEFLNFDAKNEQFKKLWKKLF